MKTAVSIPNAVFQRAERLAKRLKKSRSQLYAEAIAEYAARHEPDEITESWNRALEEAGPEDGEEAAFVREAARRTLERNEW